jgi:hypothetical protein
MPTEDFIQNLISQLGQSQPERLADELRPHFADVDERTPSDLLAYAAKLASRVHYYGKTTSAPAGDWTSFVTPAAAAALEATDGNVAPHLGLLLAFLKLYELPRTAINRFTGRHLDFYYRQVLRFQPRAAVPDRAHVLFELKKNVSPVRVLPEHALSAGKDATGVEQIYQPVVETVINAAKLDELRSIYVDPVARGTVGCATVANSGDGVGGALPANQAGWYPFGSENLPLAPIGFALSSPVLRMREGDRKVKVLLDLANVNAGPFSIAPPAGTFEAYLTGEKGWLGPFPVTSTLTGATLTLDFELHTSDGPVVDYSGAVHVKPFAAAAPVAQILIKAGGVGATFGYLDLKPLLVSNAIIKVEVSGVTSLTLESDAGTLDPKKTFLPFGSQPSTGSRFQIGCAEALSKNLSELSLQIRWHARPPDFGALYANYGLTFTVDDHYFTASVAFQDAGHGPTSIKKNELFAPLPQDNSRTIITFTPGGTSLPAFVPEFTEIYEFYALRTAGSLTALRNSASYLRVMPVFDLYEPPPPPVRSDFITLQLERDFFQEKYRTTTIANLIAAAKSGNAPTTLQPSYTPAIEDISVSYKANTNPVDLSSTDVGAFANPEIRFFHVDAFGSRREHAHLRQQLGFLTETRVPLVPEHDHQGELLLGLANLNPGDSISMLFQVAEGSADPDITWPQVTWYALCDNHWKRLGSDELVRDTTDQLRTSGVVVVLIPELATTSSTLLPDGRIWLKAEVVTDSDAARVSQLVAVAPNAVEVKFRDQGNDPAHLAIPLASGKISKLKTPIASVKAITQPFASFGGAATESSEAMETRAAERLRHKNRCVTPWDYERVVLDAFPQIHRVKCIPHARDGAWQAPGHALLVVVPDLRNTNARDPLQPKADQETLARIQRHVDARCGIEVTVKVKNPRYQKIRASFAVKFRTGYEFNAHRVLLEQDLIAFLSPWAFDSKRSLAFGGRVYRSVLLDFVAERPYVSYVTDFRMYSYVAALAGAADVGEAMAETPDAILVSDAQHDITAAP